MLTTTLPHPEILSALPIDAPTDVSVPAGNPYAKIGALPVWQEFRPLANAAGMTAPVICISRWDFHKTAKSPDHVLTIQTADRALRANVLLTVGCRTG